MGSKTAKRILQITLARYLPSYWDRTKAKQYLKLQSRFLPTIVQASNFHRLCVTPKVGLEAPHIQEKVLSHNGRKPPCCFFGSDIGVCASDSPKQIWVKLEIYISMWDGNINFKLVISLLHRFWRSGHIHFKPSAHTFTKLLWLLISCWIGIKAVSVRNEGAFYLMFWLSIPRLTYLVSVFPQSSGVAGQQNLKPVRFWKRKAKF